MAGSMKTWRPGRGTLGPMKPLLGTWDHQGDTKLGPVSCRRTFQLTLGGKFIELRAQWRLPDKEYEELALFGTGCERTLAFWSFTSDGARSSGKLAVPPTTNPRAVCFEADMPRGRARMLYWPDSAGGFWFAVEAQNKKTWSRFVEQHFKPLS